MRILTLEEATQISGHGATRAFGTVGGLIGAYYGASVGLALCTPFCLVGLILTFSGDAILPGLILSGGALGLGLFGGAMAGGCIGALVGVAGGVVTDTVISQAQTQT